MADNSEPGTKQAVWVGTILSILGSLNGQDVMRTIVLGIIGATVSFFTAALLKILCSKFKKDNE